MKCINYDFLTRTESGMAVCDDAISVYYKKWIVQPDESKKCRQEVLV